MRFSLSPAHRWPTIIVAILATQLVFGVWMARVAGSDPNHAVEPDYYARAVNWDSTMAQARRDRALGWRATTTISRSEGRGAVLQIALVDSLGAALQVDSLHADALAIAHADVIERLTLLPAGNAYTGRIATAGAGLWEVQVRAVRGADVFTAKLRTELQ